MDKIIKALELAQNQIAASRERCSDDEGELWDIYQEAIDEARHLLQPNANDDGRQHKEPDHASR